MKVNWTQNFIVSVVVGLIGIPIGICSGQYQIGPLMFVGSMLTTCVKDLFRPKT